jgi:CHAD domain-containing protein
MALEKLKPKARDEITASLARLIATRKSILNKARSELRRTVRKSDLGQLESDFIAAIEAATSQPDDGSQTPKNVPGVINANYGSIARTIILQRLRELEKLSSSLYRPFKVERLHRMRIAAKRLRYALELFEHCWGESLNRFSVKAAGLQSSLGELHDSDVWIESFGDQLTGSHRRVSKDQTEVSVWLLSHFLKVRTRHIRNALARWHDWEEMGLSSELKESVRKEPDVIVEAPVAADAKAPEELPGQEKLSGQEELAGQEEVAGKEDLSGQEELAATPAADIPASL